MFAEAYAKNVAAVLEGIWETQMPAIRKAGAMLADSLEAGGMLYVFGCGHSHMIQEELFYRAGGLAAVCPIFEPCTMLHEGAAKSSQIERMSGYAPWVMERYPIGDRDCFLATSSSGINPFIIEMAQLARAKGAKVIGISSFRYMAKPSRHKDGLHLPDVCDLCIDNGVPTGDASVQVRDDGTKAGPVSSIASMAIANAIVLTACEMLRERGGEAEVFRSGNCPGGDEYNAVLLEAYRGRSPSL